MNAKELLERDTEIVREACIKYGREKDGEYTLLFNKAAEASIFPLRWDEDHFVAGVKYFYNGVSSVITIHLRGWSAPLPDYLVFNGLTPVDRLRVIGMVSFYFHPSTRKIYGLSKLPLSTKILKQVKLLRKEKL